MRSSIVSKVAWCQIQTRWESNDLVVTWSEIQMILVGNWCEIQLIWDSNDLVVNRCVLQMILVVCWFQLQVMWLSIDLRFNWFGCQLIWDSSDLVVNRFEIQMSWLSVDLRFKWFGCQMIWGSSDLVVTRSFSSKLKFWRTKLFCETSFKNEVLKLKNEAILRDFLQKWSFEDQKRSNSARLPSKKRSFEAQKRSFCARLPSKMKLWRSKTKQFCETSFKNEALKIKNEAILRDFLQKRSFEAQKRSFCARLPSKTKLWSSKTKLLCETSFKNESLKIKNEARLPSKMTSQWTRHLTSEFQYVLTIFKWTLQQYCACHEKVEPRHTKSCNCRAKWSLQSNTSVTWNLQPFHGFCVGGFKHRHHKARNLCACHAKRIVSEPLQIHHACQRFCDPHELLRLPRILQTVEIPAPATRKAPRTSKNVPSAWCFNDFDSKSLSRAGGVQFFRSSTSKSAPNPQCFNDFFFQIALARRRGANFAKLNFQKCSEPASFWRFWLPNRSRAQAWCKFCRDQLPKVLPARQL